MSRSIRASASALWRRPIAARLCVLPVAVFTAATACAHGFGERYDLPLPLWLYQAATAAAIVLSFVVTALFVRQASPGGTYPRIELPASRWGWLVANRWLGSALRVASTILLLLAVAAGFLGSQDPYRNIAPTLIWVVGWVGLVYVSAFIGDLWPLINPWRTLFGAAERLLRKSRVLRASHPARIYPAWLGVWPAFILLFAFSWVELVYPSPALPLHVAWLIVAYSLITWLGMALYGEKVWLQGAEVFNVVFGIFARFAPTETQISQGVRALTVRPFGAGLLAERQASTSMTAVVLLILSTVLYDGALATPEWLDLETRLVALFPGPVDAAAIAVRTLGLAASWSLVSGAYLGICAVMAALVGQSSAWELARVFAWMLVPIAVAYHLAHYLVYLITQGQYIVALVSDPFGYGWNLFGSAGYRVEIGRVGARFSWYTAVVAIVVGHVMAVVLAHHRALRTIPRVAALRALMPLTALMLAYTFVSLSILAEPITERRASAEDAATSAAGVSIPADAFLPDAATGALRPVGAGRVAQQKLTYRVLGSAFHDGSKMSAADFLYAFMFAYRWGTRGIDERAHYDAAIDAATGPIREHLLAMKITGTDTTSKSFRVADVNVVRELFMIDLYTDKASGDPEQDAAFAAPWSAVPWHVLVLMEEAVTSGWAAFSNGEAARRGIEWLDLVRSERIAAKLAALVEGFARDGHRPESLLPWVTVDEARKRWNALAAFYRDRRHFLVTNGPYQLKRWSENDAELEVFRDLSYPLGVGSYDAYAVPRRGFVTNVEREKGSLRLSAEIETIMKFQRSYEIHREALERADRDVLKRAAPECRYMVVDAESRVVLAGVVQPGSDATFRVPLEGEVAPGRYNVLAEIVVNGNAMNADVRRIPVSVSAER